MRAGHPVCTLNQGMGSTVKELIPRALSASEEIQVLGQEPC